MVRAPSSAAIFNFRCSCPFPKREISRNETSRRRNSGLGFFMPKGASRSTCDKNFAFTSSGVMTASACNERSFDCASPPSPRLRRARTSRSSRKKTADSWTVNPPAAACPPHSTKVSSVARISSSACVAPPLRTEPLMLLLPSRPQRNTGRSYSSAIVFATRPRSPGRHAGSPRAITLRISLRSLRRACTARVIAPASALRVRLTDSNFFARVSASLSESVVKRRKASRASSIRLAAFTRGAIMKPISSSVIVHCSTRITRHSFCTPMRGDLRSTRSPYVASTRFSPTSGTISAMVAIPTISRSHFSHPSGTLSRNEGSTASVAHTSFHATAAPQRS